ncbi:hypothetical protein BHM03_00053761, partial [Ensete ventricosum]
GKQITSVASSCAVLFAGPRWAHKDILAPLDSYQRVIDKAVSRNLMHPRVHHGSRFASSFDEGTPNLFATLLWITVAPRVTATQSSEREIRCQFCPPPTSCITSHCTSRPLVNGSELNDLARLSQIVRGCLTPNLYFATPIRSPACNNLNVQERGCFVKYLTATQGTKRRFHAGPAIARVLLGEVSVILRGV